MTMEEAIHLFKQTFSMYANVTLTGQKTSSGWKIYLEGVSEPIGVVKIDGTPELY